MLNDLGNMMNHFFAGNRRIIGGRAHHQQRPAEHAHQQGNSSLVDLRHTLQSYTQIANTKDSDNQNR